MEENSEEKEDVLGLIEEILSKNQNDMEVRLIKHSYKPQVDEQSSDIPRLYVEVDRKIRIEEVCLGTKIDPLVANEIATWLYETDRVHKVSVSKRHYR